MGYIRGPLPDNMGCMVNLTMLEIYSSPSFSAFPDSLGELRSLKELEVFQCGLTALPASVAALSRLRSLRVFWAKLQSCPPLGALRQLRALDLHDNYLISLPEGITGLPLLKRVNIFDNCIYILQWDVIKRLPLIGSDPLPDTYDPSNGRLRRVLAMRCAERRGW